jgi:tryptophan-rich sensory protein
MTRLGQSAPRNVRWSILVCIAVPLCIGQLVPALVFALDPTAARGISPADVGLPAWWFVLIFTAIYACMGIAFWQVLRHSQALTIPTRLLLAGVGAGFVQTLLFWSARGLQAILVADLNSVLVAGAVTALVFCYCRPAAWWLMPWLGWMIATTILKIIVIAGA